MTKIRNTYFDFLRGIAIIMVVGIHTLPAEDYTVYSLQHIITIIIRQLLNCAVPIFLAISGFFIARKDLSSKRKRINFWKVQIPKVYIPYIIFSLGWFLIDLLTSNNNPIKSLVQLIICGYSIYYFIALIIQLYFLAPLLTKINKWGGVIVSAVLSTISILIVTYMLQIEGKSFPLIIYAGPCILWIFFFMLGIFLAKHTRNYSVTPSLILILIGFVASVVETFIYLPIHGGGLGIKISSFIYSSAVVIFLFSSKTEKAYKANPFTRIILYIGAVSFSVYLLHMYISVIIHRLMPFDNWAINWITTLGITVFLIVILKRFLPVRLHKFIGLR